MKTIYKISLILGIAIIIGIIVVIATAEDPTNPGIRQKGDDMSRNAVRYTENINVPFDNHGRVDYDLLIKEVLPPLWAKQLQSMGVNVSGEHMVLLRGFQILIYEDSSYQCGYVIDDNEIYWLEGSINKSKIYDVNVFTEIPIQDIENYENCWCMAEHLAAEQIDFVLSDRAQACLITQIDIWNYWD